MGKIKIKEENKGKFTNWAKSHGMSVQEAASKILRNREKYSPALIKRANFARNASKWEEGGEFGVGGSMSAAGGVLSAIPTPWTQIAGAGISMLGGIIGGNEQEKAAQQQRMLQQQQGANFAQAGIMNNYPNVFKFGGQFKGKKFGGKPNAEVEGSEIVITPDGVPTNVQGPSHAQGGVGVQLPNSSLIISKKYAKDITPLTSKINKNSEIVKGSSTQLAKNSAKRNLSKYYSTVMDTYNTQERKKFAGGGPYDNPQLPGENRAPYWPNQQGAMNVLNNMWMPGDLSANVVGNRNVAPGNPNEYYPYHQGIREPMAQTPTAYPTNVPTNNNNFWDNTGINPYNFYNNTPTPGSNMANDPRFGAFSNVPEAGITPTNTPISKPRGTSAGVAPVTPAPASAEAFRNPFPLGNLGYMNENVANNISPNAMKGIAPAPVAGLDKTYGGTPATGDGMPDAPNNFGNIAASIGEMAPMLYNLGRGLFGKKDTVNAERYANPYEGQINSLMANRRYNIDAGLNSNEAAFRTTAANMRNLGGSRGQVMSNLTGAQNTKQFGDMALYGQKNNVENQYRGEQAAMQYGLGRDTVNTRMSVDEGNRMTDAAKSNMVGAGMTGLQQYLLTRRQMKNQTSRDKLLLGAIKAYSPYAQKWIPGLNDIK